VVKSGALWNESGSRSHDVDKMPANDSSEAIYYNSLYRHGVDEKRRVQVPAKWLPKAGSVEFTLILWPKHKEGACLRALPPKKMAELLATLDAMPNTDPQKTVLKRVIGSKSVQVAADKAGRICLPEDMAAAAGIKAEAMLVGLLDRFEIWNPDAHAKLQAADEVMAHEAFKLME
jgi:MraZ protein